MRKFLDIFKEALSSEEKSYTTGSINRAIVLLAIPMVLEMAMESLFAVVDAFFVAKVSADAIATVGLTESVITLIYAVGIGMSTAPVAMISRYIGAGEKEKASKVILQAMYLALGVSLLLGIPGLIFAPDILRLMGGSESLIASGSGYARIMFGGNIVIMMLFLLNGIFRGAGDASYAMQSLWVANIINIILDPLFIFGIGPFPEMGVQGAAVATTIGRGIGVGFQLWILLSGKSTVKFYLKTLRLDWTILRKLADIAATGAGQFLIASASWIFLMRIISRWGSEAISGYTIAIRLIIFTLLPSWGLANAASTLVGQNLGAKQPDRAATSVWRAANMSMVFLFSVSIVYFIAARPLIQFFTLDPLIVEYGIISLRIFAVGYVFFAYGMVISQAFNGAGDTRTPTLINFICFWLIEIPLGYFLAVQMGFELAGICWAITLSETMLSVIAIWLFRRGKWKTVVV
ncbi:MAG: MATE family efflux transporter [Saprospiraceae bacterium]|nr:MAG: MATE family efflux transporter [Saprospiraceae bacterium]